MQMQLDTNDINENTKISDLIEAYPFIVDFLMEEFGLHCVNCIFSNFDTLKMGAKIHGIEGEELKEMIVSIRSYIRSFTEQNPLDS